MVSKAFSVQHTSMGTVEMDWKTSTTLIHLLARRNMIAWMNAMATMYDVTLILARSCVVLFRRTF